MEHFSVGVVSVVFALFFPLIYYVGFQARRLGAWSKREAPPKDRIAFFIFAALVFGVVAGSLVQPYWDKGIECKAVGTPIASCLLSSK
jgi:hypothetical protein